MSMHYEYEHDAQSIFELLTDPDFLVNRCLELGELEASCEVEENGDETVVSLTRIVERDLPRVLAKVFDPVQTIRMKETWVPDGPDAYKGNYVFEVVGQPVTVKATFELYSTDDGCCYAINHTVKARVPLIGGQVEKFILGQVADGCLAEMEYVEQQLA
jgi:hypothetical protein